MRGVIKGVSGHHLWLEMSAPIPFLVNTEVDVDIKKHREKRSLNANAYFHVLVDKLRLALNISFAECKNNLITSYGQIEYIDDVPVTIKTNIPADIMMENETLHCKPLHVEDTDAFWYRVYRGTHTYNSQEMAQLIDKTIQEIKEVAPEIETMTPNELARLEGYEKCYQ